MERRDGRTSRITVEDQPLQEDERLISQTSEAAERIDVGPNLPLNADHD